MLLKTDLSQCRADVFCHGERLAYALADLRLHQAVHDRLGRSAPVYRARSEQMLGY